MKQDLKTGTGTCVVNNQNQTIQRKIIEKKKKKNKTYQPPLGNTVLREGTAFQLPMALSGKKAVAQAFGIGKTWLTRTA